MNRFRAPWSKSLKILSVLAVALCLAIAFMPHSRATPANPPFFWLRAVPIATNLISALFTIRGYGLEGGDLLVLRLLWSTRLSLEGLRAVELHAGGLRGAWRVFGNGGLFSFTGLYRSRELGLFRAYVTDPGRVVVLRFPGRTVVLSPDDAERFVGEVRSGLW